MIIKMTKPFLSVCMIVKDEEKMLRQNLPAIAEAVEELIIIDTGSTDKTKEIATTFTEHVYDFEWSKDFAAARNFAASKATGEWILALDADERIDSDNFRKSVEKLRENADEYNAYYVHITNFSDKGYGAHSYVNRMVRLYRNEESIKYERPLHEQLVKIENGKEIALQFGEIPLEIYHYGYLSSVVEEKRKIERNTEILEQGSGIDKEDGFYFYNRAQHFMAENKYEEALESLIKAYKSLDNGETSGWLIQCMSMIITCLINLKRYDDALTVISDAEVISAKTPDFPICRAMIYYEQGRMEDAKEIFHHVLNNADAYDTAATIGGSKDVIPHEMLGDIYEKEKDYQNAITYYTHGLAISYSYSLLRKIIMLLLKVHTEKEVFVFIKNNELIKVDSFGVALIQELLNEGYGELADLLTDFVTTHKEGIRLLTKAKRRIIELDSQVEGITNILTETELQKAIESKFIDAGDLSFLYFMTNDESIKPLVDELNTSMKAEKVIYLSILEKAIKIGKGSFVEFLLEDNQAADLLSEIADLFYKHGYEEIALDFYQKVDETNIARKGFENIIEFLTENGEVEEANRIAQAAIDLIDDNFVFYKHLIENTEDNSDFVDLASEKYEDSNWVKQQEFLANFF